MTWLQRIHYVWVRAGLVTLVAAPVAMYLMFRAQGLPADTFTTTAEVRVTDADDFLRFDPVSSTPSAGWMLLPGCPADPRAYGPLARQVAARGFVSVVVNIPYRCAPWPAHMADLRRRINAVAASCPECTWTLAGHSRGVRHALEAVRSLPHGTIASLILMASTHPRKDDYSALPLRVLKILGSEDGVAPLETSLANRALLPATTRFEVIDGGNHRQFGYYGYQLFDGSATISRAEQHRQVTELVSEWLHGQ